jgi:S1-C subfamily serine protease
MKLCIRAADNSNPSSFEFTEPIVTLGRGSDCSLSMPEMLKVSWHHARLLLTPEAAYLIDEGSSNGTFLNDQRIAGRTPVKVGDYVQLGKTGPSFQIIEMDLTHDVQMSATSIPPDSVDDQGRSAEGSGISSPSQATVQTNPATTNASLPAQPPKSSPASLSEQNRQMILSLEKRNRTIIVGTIIGLATLLLIGGASGIYFLAFTKRQVERQAEQQAEWCNSIYAHHQGSVYYVVIGGPDGSIFDTGTAFAIDRRGKLATNGHIASHVRQALGRQQKVEVISQGGQSCSVIQAEYHPEFNADKPNTPDIGWLKIQLPQGELLPSAVELASVEDLRKLRPGDPICYIGFPNWREVGTDPSKITPHVYAGTVTRITTLNEELGEFSNQYLLQHEMATTSGASGSPIFNRNGKVIAIHKAGSTANDMNRSDKTTTPAVIDVKTGIRIDLLNEVLK